MKFENVNEARFAQNLSRVIQIATVSHENEDDTDWSAFAEFHQFLRDAYPKTFSTLEVEEVGRAGLILHWKGSDASLDPIGFLAHQDVVPIAPGTEDDWTNPPFSGANDGTFIWGRGALDMKGDLLCIIEAIETLLEEGYAPKRDVYVCLDYNEEIVAGKDNGAKKIAQVLHERGIHFDSILDEGGGSMDVHAGKMLDAHVTMVGVAEKGYADYEITVKGQGGHSSFPPKHTALGLLAELITKIENHPFEAHFTSPVLSMFSTIGSHMTSPLGGILKHPGVLKPILKSIMKGNSFTASMVQTSTAVTMASASPAPNVLPESASTIINFRLLQGDTLASVQAHLENLAKDYDASIRLIKGKEASAVSPIDTKSFRTIDAIFAEGQENAFCTPYLLTACTDSYHYECVCENLYRFSPFSLPSELTHTPHSTNERFPVDQIVPGVSFFMQYIRRMDA